MLRLSAVARCRITLRLPAAARVAAKATDRVVAKAAVKAVARVAVKAARSDNIEEKEAADAASFSCARVHHVAPFMN
jgi:hypothetical protein